LLINELKKHHTQKTRGSFLYLPIFIFLCGKDRNAQTGNNRAAVERYFKSRKDNVFCIYAEDLFVETIDLLSFEIFLTEMSDYIILFVESEGSACELGAFAMNPHLYEKMIVFRDISKKVISSFINDGPLKRISHSSSSHIAYTDLSSDTALSYQECKDVFCNLRFYRTCRINRDEHSVNVRTFMVELLELIRILGPINQEDLLGIYKFIKAFKGFTFVSETNSGSSSSRINIQIAYILDVLTKSGTITYENKIITLAEGVKVGNIMFELSDYKLYSLRTKFLAKKYKYGKAMEA